MRMALAYARKLEATALLTARRHRYAIKKAVRIDMSAWMEAIVLRLRVPLTKLISMHSMPSSSD
eukprot:11662059-Heterocapsa_arctica.AAC.1